MSSFSLVYHVNAWHHHWSSMHRQDNMRHHYRYLCPFFFVLFHQVHCFHSITINKHVCIEQHQRWWTAFACTTSLSHEGVQLYYPISAVLLCGAQCGNGRHRKLVVIRVASLNSLPRLPWHHCNPVGCSLVYWCDVRLVGWEQSSLLNKALAICDAWNKDSQYASCFARLLTLRKVVIVLLNCKEDNAIHEN